MKKPVILFLVAFVLSALVTLAVRTARHDPYAPAVTATAQPATPPAPQVADPHAGHTAAATATPAAPTVVNTVCTLCGMDVDPSIKPAEYQGKLIGFGCRACPPRFAAEPDRYGPSALRNEVLDE